VTRRQLRAFRDPDDEAAWYAGRYPAGYDHTAWADHRVRVRATVCLAITVLGDHAPLATVADLSCGDAAIPMAIATNIGASLVILGDALGPPAGPTPIPVVTVAGSLPGTVGMLGQTAVYVCSETLEHLPDPDGLLAALRPRVRFLVVSTPVGADADDNPEHYWSWSAGDVTGMLTSAGFDPLLVATVDPRSYYTFGIWICQ
jgi:hypothetical protein